MAITPIYSFELIGTNSRKTTLRFVGQEIDGPDAAGELVAAAANLESLRTALNVLTDANVNAYNFAVSGTGAVGGLPADADIFEEAVLSLDITPAGEATKLASTRIPAPSDAMFIASDGPGKDVVDVTDLNIVAWVNTLGSTVTVSDGETPNGVVSGYRRLKGGRAS